MTEGVTWGTIFPVVATLFGVLASALMGMAVARLHGIETHLATDEEQFLGANDVHGVRIGTCRLVAVGCGDRA